MMMKTSLMSAQSDVEGPRWRAVVARDLTADGQFVYAVRSTGVYCRPSCPSRKPAQSGVEFFPTPEEANARGYRACRRCRPDMPAAADPWVDKIRRACVHLAKVEGQPSLATLARRLGGSPYHLQRNFKRIVGVTPREFAEAARLKKVKQQLKGGCDVTTAVLDAGFGSSRGFYERAASKLGMPPASYKHGGAGASIRYAITRSPLGRLLVAATDRGVCAVAMGDSEAELRQALEREYPASRIAPDRRALGKWTRQVIAHLSGRLPRLDLPLDIRATAFQWQVWNALASIPRGETRSYAAVAASIGRPTAARAVARACATNPVALAIPCHRVVPAAGGVGGYRWGATRKSTLLAREQSCALSGSRVPPEGRSLKP
jgi:AraC family transcriptional regulator, regulatory protein of adaptative response / methylated-DNA-[protein]-cysteine methyltransferase